MMNNKIIANKINLLAEEIMAESDYVYDSQHKNKPHGGTWYKTEKGWTTHKPLRDPHKKGQPGEYDFMSDFQGIVNNPKTPANVLHDALSFLEDMESYDSYHQVLQNKNVSSEDVDWVAEKYMAHDADIDDQDMMEHLQENAFAVIDHPNVEIETLEKLTNAHDKEVAKAAKQKLKSKNFPTSKEQNTKKEKENSALMERAKNGDIEVLDDPNVDADVIRAINYIENHDDEMKIINHPKTPDDILRRYVTQWDGYEPDKDEEDGIAGNNYDMFMEEMEAISSHPNVSKETLKEMSKFKNPQVKEWANKSFKSNNFKSSQKTTANAVKVDPKVFLLKKKYIENMDPSDYGSASAFQKAKNDILNMPDDRFKNFIRFLKRR